MESASGIQERAATKAPGKPTRAVHRYTIPATLAQNGSPREVGLVQLTSGEELMATKRSRKDQFRLAYELAKQSLVEVDGQRVGAADGSVDTAWDKMPPKIRTLVITAFGDLHAPEDDEVSAFLKSQRVTVG